MGPQGLISPPIKFPLSSIYFMGGSFYLKTKGLDKKCICPFLLNRFIIKMDGALQNLDDLSTM